MVSSFSAVFVALYVAHLVGDMWVQTDRQARAKAAPGWAGRLACAAHVGTLTATMAIVLAVVATRCGVSLDLAHVASGLAANAISHYVADRRTPLAYMARTVGLHSFAVLGTPRPGHDDAPHLGTGMFQLDQAWHLGWLFITALIII